MTRGGVLSSARQTCRLRAICAAGCLFAGIGSVHAREWGDINPHWTGGDGTVGTLTLNGDVAVTGTIRLDEGDKIVVNGALDLSGATVEIIGNGLSNGFTFASATDGVTGVPAISTAGGWDKRCKVTVSQDGSEVRVMRVGFMVIVR